MFLVESWRHPERDTDLLHCAAFVTFFPHLIAGPIVRPHDIIPQLQYSALGRPRSENISAGLLIFLLGLGKKLVLADLFGGFADIGFDAAANGAQLSFFEAWYAAGAYALQIYFDFSGYSDMAIGLARMVNIRFPLNFDSPYQAANISAFWRRWHITLGAFLRDYVYIPMGGSRHGKYRRLGNLMLTMLLVGLWHGAAWRFVLWGGLHGVFLAIHAWFRGGGLRLPGPLAQGADAVRGRRRLGAVPRRWAGYRVVDAASDGRSERDCRAVHDRRVLAIPGTDRDPGAGAALSRRRADPEFSRGHGVSTARLVHRPRAAQHPCHVRTRPQLGVDVGVCVHRAGVVFRAQSCALPVFSVLIMLRRVVLPCLASLAIYLALFGLVLDRPLSLGMFRHLMDAKLARGASIEGRKLVIIAGSNGLYSHRCETMEPLLGIPCVNGGVVVGIGLDYLFAQWEKRLHPGDIVYLPMEEAQYIRSYAANSVGPDAAIMFRHERSTLAALGMDRWLGAAFSFDPRAALMSLIETALVWSGFQDPRAADVGSTNAWGDHVGHTAALGQTNAAHLATMMPFHQNAAAIASGDGTAMIRDFIAWAEAHGVIVVGGLPAGFARSPIPDAARDAICTIYTSAGARFIDLHDRYPPSAFFDTPDHLNEAAQIERSQAVAAALAVTLAPAQAASR